MIIATSYKPMPAETCVVEGHILGMVAEREPIDTNTEELVRPATILIAEDDPNIRDVLHALLEGEGYEPLVVSNGQEALDLALAQSVDVILLDLQMPVLNGEAFCTAYREHGGKPPVVLLTAASKDIVQAAITACGAAGSRPRACTARGGRSSGIGTTAATVRKGQAHQRFIHNGGSEADWRSACPAMKAAWLIEESKIDPKERKVQEAAAKLRASGAYSRF